MAMPDNSAPRDEPVLTPTAEYFHDMESAAFTAGFAAAACLLRGIAAPGSVWPPIATHAAWVANRRPLWRYGTWMLPVTSSNLAAIGWHAGRLLVTFIGGTTWLYDHVTLGQFQQLLAARSKGGHFATTFRNNPNHPGIAIVTPTTTRGAADDDTREGPSGS